MVMSNASSGPCAEPNAFRNRAHPICPRHRTFALAAMAVLMLSAVPPENAHANGRDLRSYVTKKAAVVSTMHRKSMRALVNAAQDRAFENYFQAHGDQDRRAAKERIEQVSLATQSRFHVEEMCLIDASGPEIARIVGDRIAPESDLSPDESGADFFEPGFAEEPRQVFVSRPYLSPDANKWVIAYVTPVAVEHANKAVLHYEHGLDTYQAALTDDEPHDGRFLVAVSGDGYVVFDSRKAIVVDGRDGKENPADYFARIDDMEPEGLSAIYRSAGEQRTGATRLTHGGDVYDVAFAKVEGDMVLMAIERE